jgi:hypothetical protein
MTYNFVVSQATPYTAMIWKLTELGRAQFFLLARKSAEVVDSGLPMCSQGHHRLR